MTSVFLLSQGFTLKVIAYDNEVGDRMDSFVWRYREEAARTESQAVEHEETILGRRNRHTPWFVVPVKGIRTKVAHNKSPIYRWFCLRLAKHKATCMCPPSEVKIDVFNLGFCSALDF